MLYRIYNMKKETKLNVPLKAMRFDEAICELNITVVIQTVIKAHKVMATYCMKSSQRMLSRAFDLEVRNRAPRVSKVLFIWSTFHFA